MKLASSWLRVEADGKTVIVGVFVAGARKIELAFQSRRKKQPLWLQVLGKLAEGEWFSYRSYELVTSRARIERFLLEINENAGTNFLLASRCLHGCDCPERGLIGG